MSILDDIEDQIENTDESIKNHITKKNKNNVKIETSTKIKVNNNDLINYIYR